MIYSDYEAEIVEIMNKICPDFSEYNFLKTDRYKGSLFGGYNIYYKSGENGVLGMITGKKNQNKYNLDRFDKNFETTGGLDGTQKEEGWTGQTLLQLLEHLQTTG